MVDLTEKFYGRFDRKILWFFLGAFFQIHSKFSIRKDLNNVAKNVVLGKIK